MASRPPAPWHAPDASRRRRRREEPSVRDTIAAIATRQAGVVARWQLLAARIESNTIDRLIRSGHLRTVHDGVYAVGQRSLDPVARYWAAVLACGPEALLGGWSAVAHVGVVGRRDRTRVDVVVPPGHKPAPHGVAVRRLVLHRTERTTVRGLASVSGIRAVLDVGVTSGAKDAERVWRGLVHAGRLDLDEAAAFLERHHGERGIGIVRALYDRRVEIVGAAESGLEERVAACVVRAGLPEPHRNVARTLSSGSAIRFDLLLPDLALAIEADGPYHDDPEVQAEDALRDAEAAADGIRTVRVNHREKDVTAVARLVAVRRTLLGA